MDEERASLGSKRRQALENKEGEKVLEKASSNLMSRKISKSRVEV